MQMLLTLCAVLILMAGCQPSGREVIVTRDQFGEAWPLQVNSAKVVCAEEGEPIYLRIGRKLYGLNAEAQEAPPVSEVVRQIPVDPRRPNVGAWPADPTPLLDACDAAPGNVASG